MRYFFPVWSAARVYMVMMILYSVTPRKFRVTGTPVAASAPTGIPNWPHSAAVTSSAVCPSARRNALFRVRYSPRP